MKLEVIFSKAFCTTDSALAFAHFRREAEAVEVPADYSFRQDVAVARYNVSRAMAVMSDRLPDVARALPSADVVALAELPTLALAVVHAQDRVPAYAPSTREIDGALSVVRPLRALTLSYLEVAAALDLVPVGRVRAIREGSGKLDEARDCVAIVALFDEHRAALAKKHPFTPAQIKTLAEKGAWLVQTITPGNASPITAPRRSPESMERDRVVRLLEERYDQLRTAAVVCFGLRDIDAKVPPLWSSTRASSEPVEEPAPEPVPAPEG